MLKLASFLHYYLLVLFELFRISADQLATNRPSFSRWLDPANWRHDKTAELQSTRAVAEHFAMPLVTAGYEGVKLQSEWERLNVIQKSFYEGVDRNDFWEAVLLYRRKGYRNVCMLVEVLLTICMSYSTVECGFSMLTVMLSDRRLSLNHQTMEDLLVIKANHNAWTTKEMEDNACNTGNSNTVCSTMSSLTETYTGEIPSSQSAPKCDGLEQLVLKSLDQILTGQDKLKKDLETFKLDITKSVEFQGKEIEDLKKEKGDTQVSYHQMTLPFFTRIPTLIIKLIV